VRTSRDWIGERRLCAAPDGSIEADCSGPSPRSVPESQDPPAVPPTAAGSSGGFGQARDSAAEEARERGECCLEAVETGEAARNVPLGVAVACGVFADAQHRADGVPRHTPVAGSSDDGRRQAVELLVQLGNPLQGFFSVKGRQKPREVACTVLYVLGDLDEEFVPGRRAVSARWGRGLVRGAGRGSVGFPAGAGCGAANGIAGSSCRRRLWAAWRQASPHYFRGLPFPGPSARAEPRNSHGSLTVLPFRNTRPP
jgi:hypothetical protein